MRRQTLHNNALLLLLAGLLFVVPHTASAQDLPSQQLVSLSVSLISVLIGVLNALTWVFLMILDKIMDPNFIFSLPADGGDGPLLTMLHEIWQFTRDLVNLGFALGLIAGAVIMIVTSDFTKMKEHIGKFVLALVLVNFSWFIPRVIFDVSQVLTYTVYGLPSLLGNSLCELPATDGPNALPRRPCEVILQFKFLPEQTRTIVDGGGPNGTGRDTSVNPPTIGWRCPLRPIVCYQAVAINDANPQIRTSTKVLEGLIVNHARLQTLVLFQPDAAQVQLPVGIIRDPAFLTAIWRFAAIIIKLVVILLIHIAILFPIIAMSAAFFIRIPVLWVSMAFMPLVALGFAFPKLREGEYGDLFWKWQEHFLNAVFLPVRVAVPFTIGFIMLNAGTSIGMPAQFGGVNANIIPIINGVSNLWHILWMGIAITIIWKYGFQALSTEKAGEFMGMFTAQIKSFGNSLGSMAMQIPMNVPFIPMGTRIDERGNKVQRDPASIGKLFQMKRNMESELRLGQFGSKGSSDRVFGTTDNRNVNTQAVSQIQTNTTVTQNVTNNLNTAINLGTPEQRNTGVRDALNELRTSSPLLQRLTDQELIASLEQAGKIDADRRRRLEEILRNGRPAT